MDRVAALIPVLARPHRVRPTLEAFAGANVYFIVDRLDGAEQREIAAAGGTMLKHDGTFAEKINYGVQQTTEPLVFIGADDIEPQLGWFEAALARLDGDVQIVGVNDLIERPQRPEHATHFLLTREYAQLDTFDGLPGPCAEVYHHWYVDDELIATGQMRGAYAFAADSHVRHLHPMVGTAPDDDTYRKGRSTFQTDARIYHRRMRALNEATPEPTLDVTIGVPTFGGDEWIELARERAIPSATAQGVPTIHRHADTLQDARNAILADVQTEFVIYLDADDELEPGYVQEMAKGTADLRAPRVRCLRDGRFVAGGLFMPRIGDASHRNSGHRCDASCLPYGNWLVIGTCARTELLRAVGGWDDWPLYEDWAMWLKCWKHGCTIEPVLGAIYRQHLGHESRNHAVGTYDERFSWHERIVTSILGEVPA